MPVGATGVSPFADIQRGQHAVAAAAGVNSGIRREPLRESVGFARAARKRTEASGTPRAAFEVGGRVGSPVRRS